jgi:hypothetical protein
VNSYNEEINIMKITRKQLIKLIQEVLSPETERKVNDAASAVTKETEQDKEEVAAKLGIDDKE